MGTPENEYNYFSVKFIIKGMFFSVNLLRDILTMDHA